MVSMKVTNLSDIGQTFIMLTCKKGNEMQLLSDWSRMLDDYPILCDLWSDVITAEGGALASIETLDKRGMSAWGQPSPSNGVDRFVIFVCKKYFAKNSFSQRKAILLHELGHFYVHKKGILAQLRQDWKKGEALFRVFIAPLEIQDSEHVDSYKEWFKKFYDQYIFDLLKIPGEYYANLWVKVNFEDIFGSLLEGQYEGSKSFFETGFSNLQKGLIKFPLFSLILRLNALILLIDDKANLEKFMKLKEDCWSELEKCTTKDGFQFLKEFEGKIVRLSASLESANALLIDALEKYIRSFPIKVDLSERYY